jgi:tRNA U55 pseudouridine synthase TruB
VTVLRFVHSDPFRERERETVRVREATTDERYGKRPEERSVEDLLRFGYIAVDKHSGPTSQDVVSSVWPSLPTKLGSGAERRTKR